MSDRSALAAVIVGTCILLATASLFFAAVETQYAVSVRNTTASHVDSVLDQNSEYVVNESGYTSDLRAFLPTAIARANESGGDAEFSMGHNPAPGIFQETGIDTAAFYHFERGGEYYEIMVQHVRGGGSWFLFLLAGLFGIGLAASGLALLDDRTRVAIAVSGVVVLGATLLRVGAVGGDAGLSVLSRWVAFLVLAELLSRIPGRWIPDWRSTG